MRHEIVRDRQIAHWRDDVADDLVVNGGVHNAGTQPEAENTLPHHGVRAVLQLRRQPTPRIARQCELPSCGRGTTRTEPGGLPSVTPDR